MKKQKSQPAKLQENEESDFFVLQEKIKKQMMRLNHHKDAIPKEIQNFEISAPHIDSSHSILSSICENEF